MSADAEWKALPRIATDVAGSASPYGEWFSRPVKVAGRDLPVIFFHGGWGKIAAAGSTQYAIDRWKPELLVNLGTCGGIRGAIPKGAVLLANRTLVYDIVEQMGDPAEAIAAYATDIDLAWATGDDPKGVQRGLSSRPIATSCWRTSRVSPTSTMPPPPTGSRGRSPGSREPTGLRS